MLAGLGFTPFYAAAICLLANTAPVAFGSIAIPIVTLAGITGLPLDRLSAGVGRICAPVSLLYPGVPDSGDGWMESLASRSSSGASVRSLVRRHAIRGLKFRWRAAHRPCRFTHRNRRIGAAVAVFGSRRTLPSPHSRHPVARPSGGQILLAWSPYLSPRGMRPSMGLQAHARPAEFRDRSDSSGPACTI